MFQILKQKQTQIRRNKKTQLTQKKTRQLMVEVKTSQNLQRKKVINNIIKATKIMIRKVKVVNLQAIRISTMAIIQKKNITIILWQKANKDLK